MLQEKHMKVIFTCNCYRFYLYQPLFFIFSLWHWIICINGKLTGVSVTDMALVTLVCWGNRFPRQSKRKMVGLLFLSYAAGPDMLRCTFYIYIYIYITLNRNFTVSLHLSLFFVISARFFRDISSCMSICLFVYFFQVFTYCSQPSLF